MAASQLIVNLGSPSIVQGKYHLAYIKVHFYYVFFFQLCHLDIPSNLLNGEPLFYKPKRIKETNLLA